MKVSRSAWIGILLFSFLGAGCECPGISRFVTSKECVIVKDEGFTYREPIQIEESPLRLDGYYYEIKEPGRVLEGTSIVPLVLWRNGTTANSSVVYDGFRTLEEARRKVGRRLNRIVTGEMGGAVNWGAFRIHNDSISLQIMQYDSDGFVDRYRTLELNGVILNDTTFAIGESITFTGPNEGRSEFWADADTFHFYPLDEEVKPSSDNWTQTHPELQ